MNELAQHPFGGSVDSKALDVRSEPDSVSDSRTAPIRYDNLQIVLHWTTVGLVVALYALAQVWGLFEKPITDQLVEVHISLGMLLAGVVSLRIFWRLSFARRLPAAEAGVMELAAKLGQAALYLLLIAVVGTRRLHALGRPGGRELFRTVRDPLPIPRRQGACPRAVASSLLDCDCYDYCCSWARMHRAVSRLRSTRWGVAAYAAWFIRGLN